MLIRISWPTVIFTVIGGILILCLYKRFTANRSIGARAPQTNAQTSAGIADTPNIEISEVEQTEMGGLVARTHDTNPQPHAPPHAPPRAPHAQQIMRLADMRAEDANTRARFPRGPTRLPPAPTFQEHLQPAWWYSHSNIAPLAERRNARLESDVALRHNPPRPPPPRTVPAPRPAPPTPTPAPVMLKVPGNVAVSSLDPTRVEIRSDTHNTHDSILVSQLGEILKGLPDPDGGNTHWLQQLRNEFPETTGALDRMERNHNPVSSLGMTECQVLGRVYNQLRNNPDGIQMLGHRLKEIQDDDPCTSGRVARVVDALVCANVGKTETHRLVTKEILRRELVAMAGAMANQNGGDLKRADFEEAATSAYVKPGLCTRAQISAELDKWLYVFSD